MSARAHEVLLRPNRGWLRINWRELYEYRDLLLALVWRDFTVKHRQTILGPLWAILTPLFTTVVFTIVFGRIARIPTEGVPPPLFYFSGLLAWNYFAHTMQQTSSTFVSNAEVFGKVAFPRLIIPLASSVSNAVTVAIQLGAMAVVWIYYRCFTDAGAGLRLQPGTLLLPLLLVQTAALAVGVGLWIASLTIRYRDLLHTLGLMIQLWMYATPIIYPLSEAPEKYRQILILNPMAPVVESFRELLVGIGGGNLGVGVHLYSIAVALGVLLSGIMMFQRAERTFIDTV